MHVESQLQKMARKRKVILPPKLNGRKTWDEGEREEGLLTPLNDKIPVRGFEDAEFIPKLPNPLVMELIWPRICQNSK